MRTFDTGSIFLEPGYEATVSHSLAVEKLFTWVVAALRLSAHWMPCSFPEFWEKVQKRNAGDARKFRGGLVSLQNSLPWNYPAQTQIHIVSFCNYVINYRSDGYQGMKAAISNQAHTFDTRLYFPPKRPGYEASDTVERSKTKEVMEIQMGKHWSTLVGVAK